MTERLGEAILRPDAAFVREATGFAIGGIPPFGHTHRLVPRLDADLLQYETVWAAAGTPNAIFEVSPARLRDADRRGRDRRDVTRILVGSTGCQNNASGNSSCARANVSPSERTA